MMGTSKQPTHAVLHISNWDGERDVMTSLCTQAGNGDFLYFDSGKPVLEYHGDEVLKVWPLVPEPAEQEPLGYVFPDWRGATTVSATKDDYFDTPVYLHPAPSAMQRNCLRVWLGPMPESNGKTNWTAILHNGDVTQGITLARSEYPDRVRYEADRVRWLLGDLDKKPFLMDYDTDLHSGYREPPKPDHVAELSMLVKRLANLVSRTSPHAHLGAQALDYLKRHNLAGSTLREGEDHESS